MNEVKIKSKDLNEVCEINKECLSILHILEDFKLMDKKRINKLLNKLYNLNCKCLRIAQTPLQQSDPQNY